MAHVFTMSADFKKGYDAWIAQQQRKKKRMPPAAHALLSQWVAAGRTNAPLPGATFDAIITYLATGEATDRLPVALADAGYTQHELDARAAGETALDVARAILARGVDAEGEDWV